MFSPILIIRSRLIGLRNRDAMAGYNERLLERFALLPDLSEKSLRLIRWFNPILRP